VSDYTRYLDALFGLRCAPDLLAAGLFPNAKEWTEAYALYWQARSYLGAETLGRRDVLALDVGCGRKPRLAGLVACMTRWSVSAIDPRLVAEYGEQHKKIHGLNMYPVRAHEQRLDYIESRVADMTADKQPPPDLSSLIAKVPSAEALFRVWRDAHGDGRMRIAAVRAAVVGALERVP